jgi:hypothetical protein
MSSTAMCVCGVRQLTSTWAKALNARRDRRRRVESFQATIAGRYWGILRLRESRNKSVVVLFIGMNVALTLEARLAMGSSKV